MVRATQVALAAGGVHAMHDPTEGGLATGLRELAGAAGAGLDVDAGAIPVLPETLAICQALGLDPLGLIASGALLVAADPEAAPALVAALHAAGIPAAPIGRLTPPAAGYWMEGPAGRVPLPSFARDEIARYFG